MCQITGIEFEFEHERYKIYLTVSKLYQYYEHVLLLNL